MINYGNKMKELREYEGLSQREVAEAIGISRSAYNQFEKQYDIIPIKRLNQIANFFDVSIDYLFGLTKTRNYLNSNKNIDINISSKRLKNLRKENNLTQEKLKDYLNASVSVIVHHENKRTIIGTPFLYTICKKFKISADYLLGRIDEKITFENVDN